MGPAARTPIAKAMVMRSATASIRWATSRFAASFRRGIGTRRYEAGSERGWVRLPGVRALGVELLADETKLLVAGGLGLADVVGDLQVPARALADQLERHAG